MRLDISNTERDLMWDIVYNLHIMLLKMDIDDGTNYGMNYFDYIDRLADNN